MLKERVISALVGIPIILLALFLGPFVFAVLIAAIVVVSLDELYSIFILRDYKPNIIIGVLGGVAVVAAALFGGNSGIILALALVVLIGLAWLVFSQGSIVNTGLTFAGIVYIAFTLSHLVLNFRLSFGSIGILVIFIGTWISDISAYAFGSAIGKRKLAPSVSANKTIEGTLAGLIVPAIVLGLVFLLPVMPFIASDGLVISFLKGFGMGLAIGLVAPIGDLVESRIKREMRVKDSGTLIPGHGGFLDRFDSVLFTAVVGYYIWLIIVP